MSTIDHERHEVSGATLPRDDQHIGPLLGNNDLKLVLDAHGCMHDFQSQPAWPPPRIVWTGRRHNKRIDRYNSNQFEYGFFDLQLDAELPAVTGWRQQLHPTAGHVTTRIDRGPGCSEETTTFLALNRNLIACRRRYHGCTGTARASYTFCHLGTDEIPFRTTWQPGDPEANGIAANFTADGHRIYHGRLALFSDRPCLARAVANRLELEIPLDADGCVTFYLAMEDDLGDDPQLVGVFDGDWMPKGVRQVHRENAAAAAARQAPDPVANLQQTRELVDRLGFDGLFDEQRAAWQAYHDRYQVTLPAGEPKLAAAIRGAIYHVRCGYSNWCWGSSPFNQSWGAHYAWNERYPVEGLLAWGVTDMPKTVMAWRRRILPFLSMRTSARGAFYHHSSTEPGMSTSERNGTNFWEMFLPGIIVNYIYIHARYEGDGNLYSRYWPVIREVAEFYRHWVFMELPGNNLMTVPMIDVNESIFPVHDGPFTVCSGARAFDLVVRFAELLHEDEELLPVWQRYRAMTLKLARHIIPTGTNAACYDDLELGLLPEPELEIDPAIQAWRDAYRKQHQGIDQHKTYGQDVSGDVSKPRNWPWAGYQQAHLHATRLDAAKSIAGMRRALPMLLPFGGQCESGEETFSRVDHPWFTTASGALLRAMARMLLYPKSLSEIYLLPGVPEEWQDLSFELPAFGDLRVRVHVADGKLTCLRVTPGPAAQPGNLTLYVPGRLLGQAESWYPIRCTLHGEPIDLTPSLLIS